MQRSSRSTATLLSQPLFRIPQTFLAGLECTEEQVNRLKFRGKKLTLAFTKLS